MEIYCKILTLIVIFNALHYVFKRIEFRRVIKQSNICSKNTNSRIQYEDCMGTGQFRKTLEKLKQKRNKLKNEN